MLETITEAAKNFCLHQLGEEATICDTIPNIQNAIVASIEIHTQEEERYTIYFITEKEFIQFVASVFLDEESSDNETLEDLTLECLNLVVGNAKVLASQKDTHFNITTPNLLEYDAFMTNIEEKATIACHGYHFFIALKKEG